MHVVPHGGKPGAVHRKASLDHVEESLQEGKEHGISNVLKKTLTKEENHAPKTG